MDMGRGVGKDNASHAFKKGVDARSSQWHMGLTSAPASRDGLLCLCKTLKSAAKCKNSVF